MCGPRGLPGEPDHLFHNNGDGTFTDVSAAAGVADKPGYYGLASVFIDVNNDGRPDLLVADDSTPNYLYLNKGDGTFEDVSYASGYALNKDGRETASMGIAVADYRNNGLIDIYNTTFSDDYKPLYRNDGDANFTDISYESRISNLTIPFLGWGTAFLDYDNDGWRDLLEVNGHVYRNADANNWGTTWAQRPLLFHNLAGKSFDTVPAVEGTALAQAMTSRGLAIGDLFNDGHMDAVINNLDAVPALLRNASPDKNHWIAFKLIGGPKSPRDGIGSTVYLTTSGLPAGKIRQRSDVFSGGSFASSSDQRPHFGLGSATTVEKLEVDWPSGLHEQFQVPAIDTFQTLTEGQGAPLPKGTANNQVGYNPWRSSRRITISTRFKRLIEGREGSVHLLSTGRRCRTRLELRGDLNRRACPDPEGFLQIHDHSRRSSGMAGRVQASHSSRSCLPQANHCGRPWGHRLLQAICELAKARHRSRNDLPQLRKSSN